MQATFPTGLLNLCYEGTLAPGTGSMLALCRRSLTEDSQYSIVYRGGICLMCNCFCLQVTGLPSQQPMLHSQSQQQPQLLCHKIVDGMPSRAVTWQNLQAPQGQSQLCLSTPSTANQLRQLPWVKRQLGLHQMGLLLLPHLPSTLPRSLLTTS